MARRAPKFCARAECDELVVGATYCPAHKKQRDRQAWATAAPTASARAARDDPNWLALRRRVLERDRHRCQLRLPGCTITAEAVDHVVEASEFARPRDANTLSNTQAVCSHCHAVKTGRHARAKQLRNKPSQPGIAFFDDAGWQP